MLSARSAWREVTGGRRFDAHYFDARYRVEDPWGYTTRAYEKEKYGKTLEQVASRRYRSILEVGCAEGLFTRQLLPLADHVCGVDISERALERARRALGSSDHVAFRRVDVFEDSLDWDFELVVCSEVLCFARDREQLEEAGRRLASWVEPGGILLLVHLRVAHEVASGWPAPDLRFGADTIHPCLAEVTGFALESELWEDDHAFARLRRPAS